jgi:CheY-like chemotaxis protein
MTHPEKTILIVEDNIDFHTLTKLMLLQHGFRIKSLFDGKLAAVYAMLATCDVILLDVDLPSGSGAEICKKLKDDPDTCDIPIIMMTGNAEAESICVKAGADACLTKPFASSALLGKIQDTLIAR